MSLETMTKLASTTVGVGGSASITFSNIPQGYTDLKIVANSRVAGSNQGEVVNIAFNGSSSNISARLIYADAPNVTSITSTSNVFWVPGSGATSNVFGNSEVYFPNYSSNSNKSWSTDSVLENNGGTYLVLIAGLWSQPAAINSITLTPPLQPFVANSTFSLYGIKNARQTAGNSIKATGGNIVLDGTYVYHVFNSTGAFTPTQPILADCLVVAGGGGGSYLGGGGGGGYRTSVGGTPMSISSNISYTVTVGAGGAKTTSGANAFSGTNSSFNSITSTGGGGGGGITEFGPSGSGGSSGGASSKAFTDGPNTLGTANLGGYSPVEGYVGGSGTTSTSGSLSGGGGGGGGGGAGEAGSSNKGGSGGVGLNFTIDGVITGYSGGGGGGAGTDTGGLNSTATHGGAPGAFRDSTINTTAIANRGGGGGGGGSSGGGNAGAGGSGIVIIRYKG